MAFGPEKANAWGQDLYIPMGLVANLYVMSMSLCKPHLCPVDLAIYSTSPAGAGRGHPRRRSVARPARWNRPTVHSSYRPFRYVAPPEYKTRCGARTPSFEACCKEAWAPSLGAETSKPPQNACSVAVPPPLALCTVQHICDAHLQPLM